ncbi:hypothetical protein MESS2_p100004 [Mesorhizobium metallidurans STM 2683]|uniref:Uncharacterized protein n=1 Tax=Mesorhizobium metallidurans STM 2683 TaxID=1297569 RepID=M5EZ06_9HYPH|nr:hypothetical protein MESS2_p100004 [Mesorhizobium metallidurans STM 2683]
MITPANDWFAYPAVSKVIQLTVQPQAAKAKSGS